MKPSTAYALSLLRAHPEGVTSLEAWRMKGGSRFAGRVHELRQAGHIIEDVWETTDGARYVRYRLRETAQLELAL